MSDLRQDGVDEIFKRLGPFLNTGEIEDILSWPKDGVPDLDKIPCCIVLEGDDIIIKRATSNGLGYPVTRRLTVIVETWVNEETDVRALERVLKAGVLGQINAGGRLVNGVTIMEGKTVGPVDGGIPNMIGMRTFYELTYKDHGPY